MKKIIYIIFPLIVYVFAYAGVAHAADCPASPENETECTSVAGCVYKEVGTMKVCEPCSTGFYRKKNQENKYICTDCTKRPDGAEWKGNGGDSDNCPWEKTCAAGTVWNKETQNCDFCEPSNQYTSVRATIKYDGTNTTVNGDPEEDAPVCTGKSYKITIDCNFGSGCNTLYRQYGNQTDWFYDRNMTTKITPPLSQIPTRTRYVFKGYYTSDNKQIFSGSGTIVHSNADNISEETTLHAEWSYGSFKIQLINTETENVLQTINNCGFDKTDCDISYSRCASGIYIESMNVISPENCGTITDNFSKFSISENCSISDGETVKIGVTFADCPSAFYCTACVQHPCTPGATSAAGSTNKSDCHYTKNTVFRDTAGTFNLPVNDGKIKIEWNWN